MEQLVQHKAVSVKEAFQGCWTLKNDKNKKPKVREDWGEAIFMWTVAMLKG